MDQLWSHDHKDQERCGVPVRVEQPRPGGSDESSERSCEVSDVCKMQTEPQDSEWGWFRGAVAHQAAAGRSGGWQNLGSGR